MGDTDGHGANGDGADVGERGSVPKLPEPSGRPSSDPGAPDLSKRPQVAGTDEAPRTTSTWRWPLAALAACIWLALIETVLLGTIVKESLPVWSRGLILPLVLSGHLLPYCTVAALGLLVVSTAYHRTQARHSRRSWFAAGALALSAPYSIYVAHFAFSGPQMSEHPLRLPVTILAGVVLTTTSAGALVLAVWVPTSRRRRFVVAALLLTLSLACLIASALVLPNEYEPLHAFLMVQAGSSALLGFGQGLARVPRPRLSRELALAGVAVAWSVGAALFLARADTFAWVIWGGTPGSRYLTERVQFGSDASETESIVLDRVPERWKKHAGFAQLRAERRRRPAPNIVVFSVDNLAADHVGAYGYERHPTTPNIDRLAETGLLFRRAYSFYPQTRIFMSSMLFGRKAPAFGPHRPPARYQRESLTRMLKQRSYHVLVKGVFELTASRAFEPADYAIDTWLRRATSAEIRKANTIPHIPLEERFAQLEQHLKEARRTEQPVFIWMHFLQPHRFHGRFVSSPEYDFGDGWEDLYDSAVAATDRWLPKIEQMMAEHLGSARPTYWFVQSDHGAGLRQGERESGKNLLDDHVHVPLIIQGPGIDQGEVGVPVDSCIDVAKTILDLAGIDAPASYEGASLLPLFQNRELEHGLAGRAIYLQQENWSGVIYENYKLIDYRGAVSLFDLVADPKEKLNLADQEPELITRLRPSIARRAHEIRAGYSGSRAKRRKSTKKKRRRGALGPPPERR